ncbi:MAG: MarC family protein [Pseudomonadota bacterium]
MDLSLALPAFVALFVVIDPVGLAPIFVALTAGRELAERRRIALRAVIVALAVLTLFGLAGETVLSFLGISMPAFRIAGGLLLFLTALDMLFERRTERRQGKSEPTADDPAVFPLAIPLIAGPGAIAAMILLTSEVGALDVALIHLVMVAVLALVLALFLLASPLERLLGPTGIVVVTRLFGMLLAALSVQFVIDGLVDLQVL